MNERATANPSETAGVGKGWRRRYQVLMGLARAAVTWERLWPCAWPAVGVAALFVSVALLDLLPLLPFWLHSLILILFAAAFGFLVRDAVVGFHPVDEKTTRHRLEQDSGLKHRPLTAIHDRLASGHSDASARSLWRIHLRRMAGAVRKLRLGWPSPGLARFDPYGLRAALMLLLVIAAAAGGSEATARLERALVPKVAIGTDGPTKLDVWITPPAYTGLAPMFLERAAMVASAGEGDDLDSVRVRVPVGSTLLAQTGGARAAPVLKVGGRSIQFAAISEASETGSYRLETVVEDADQGADLLEVLIRDRLVARWAVQVVADSPPGVEFLQAPSRTGRAQLRIDYEARDDYGLAGVQVVIRHPEGRSVPGGQPSIRADLPLPDPGSNRIQTSSVQDFSAHPWAGLQVQVQLHAIDARGQAGHSDSIAIVLPERVFNHPVARAIAEARKKLNTPTEPVVRDAVTALRDLASRPSHFFDDTVVFLALTVSASRLSHDKTDAGVGAVQELLWETALRIEDGEFAIAERDLRKIQESLMRALQGKADSAEIERLMDELQKALEKYMSALAEHLKKQGLEELPVNPSRFMDATDLQRMIEEARELARTGAIDAAKRMLSNLQRMLDSLRAGMQAGKPREGMAQAKKLMDGLRDLAQRQQKELDRTFQRLQQREGAMRTLPQQGGQSPDAQQQRRPGRGGDKGDGEGEGAAEQETLRRDLGRLMLQMDEFLGSIPEQFGRAERAMSGAARALGNDEPGDAVPLQTEALNQLQQGTENMAEQIARRMGGAMGMTRGRQGQQPGDGRDPFGRDPAGALGTAIDDGDVKIPDQMEQRRAREILHELRRRAGERFRPEPERDYINRLLRRF